MVRALTALDPAVRVVAVSGLAPSSRSTDLDGVRAFVPKPYTATRLVRTIKGVLDGGAAAAEPATAGAG
jgi:hypothetical protein